MSLSQMEKSIHAFLEKREKLRFPTVDLETYVVDTLGWEEFNQLGGYRSLVKLIETMVAKGHLRPVKARGTNGLNPPLYRFYQKQSIKPAAGTVVKWDRLLTYYHPAIDTSYYQTHSTDYERDRDFIDTIDRFLKDRDANINTGHDTGVTTIAEMSVNERSYALFKDEKRLNSSRSKAILGRLGLDFTHLACYPTFEPFFYFITPIWARRNEGVRVSDILIVENKDTFFTLKKIFAAGQCTYLGNDGFDDQYNFEMLIYGEGKKIENSLPYIEEVEGYRHQVDGGNDKYRFWYFGDVDEEGLAIYERLASRYPKYQVQPFLPFYYWLLENEANDAPKARTVRKAKGTIDEAVTRFADRLVVHAREKLIKLLKEGSYIPQEALAFPELERMLT